MKPLLYIQREGVEAGPYDLVQMAGLLRRKIVTSETQSRLEGEDAWMPLSWQPQFSVIREMPADAISMRLEELDEEAMNRRSPIPLPSQETLVLLGVYVAGCLCLGAGAYFLAWFDASVGTVLRFAGLGLAIAAQVMIIFKIMDEDSPKLLLMVFIPLYDLYFFICNVERYYKLLAVKYASMCICVGAAWGLATHSH